MTTIHPHIAKFRAISPKIRLSVVKNLFIFTVAIIQGETVNLNSLKNRVGKITEKSKTTANSHYMRLIRFLNAQSGTLLWLWTLQYSCFLLGVAYSHRLLYLDATAWKIGVFNLHILVLSCDFKGVAIPVYFQVYPHKGVLSEKERANFMRHACQHCSLKDCILIADREFIGKEWLSAIDELRLKFVIRVRQGMYKKSLIGNRNYEQLKNRARKKGKASCLVCQQGGHFKLWVIKKLDTHSKEEFLYVLTNELKKRQIPDLYRLRWKIELLFKHFKTSGYNLEDMRIQKVEKIRLLFSMVTLAYIVSVVAAAKEREVKPMTKKVYADGRKFDKESHFKQGFSIVVVAFTSLASFLDFIQVLVNLNLNPNSA